MVKENTALSRRCWHLLLVTTLAVAGCSGDDGQTARTDKDHVWKEQTKALDKARDVERQLGVAAARQRDATH